MKLLLAFIFTFTCAVSSFAAPAEVTNISNRAYFPAVQNALAGAQKSVTAVLYLVSFNPEEKYSPVTTLVNELVAAHNRGVNVKVILDRNITYANSGNRGEAKIEDSNEALFSYLKQNDIDVSFDDLSTVTHAKAIVVDEETVIVGSTNWTDASLNNNNEANCLIVSKDLAKQFLADFSQIALDTDATDTEAQPTVKIPDFFIKDAGLAPRMIRKHDETAFDLYLLLLRNYNGNPEGRVDVDYKAFSATLGFDKHYKYLVALNFISCALDRLEKNYRLIQVVRQQPLPPYCILRELSPTLFDSNQGTVPNIYTTPKSNYCPIPETYWQYGWNQTLSLPEKVFFLVNLRKAAFYHTREWSDYRQGIIEDYTFSSAALTRAISGLRRLNIVEVEYAPYAKNGRYAYTGPMRFRLLGLYSPDALKQEKERLAKTYGQERLNQAESYARIVFKDNDPQVIEDILKKTNEYGAKAVDEAFRKISDRSAGNSKRSYKYIIGILQAETKTTTTKE